ncbi:Glycosyltransferase involved in cell wall bisynthesis [Tenacibaculum mesophilum]|uniref:Glycosyltransferase family 4 protein n=1 Tax=Tenacibaculum mesophilum TaxID=104268 RepID=A0ABM7CFA9_9FLAO|nr:glycosyltransferase [Tenacibaculum mesophilum]AZJ32467.1 glycosyltransferase family 4 protein [Tenacibaculum mesophilum]QFS27720.1 glycosyltransferase [Tenacibaculum mesophilum]SHG15737.1 Glycosyltransferase involved in cell wall bisynthesis [Tenacibaculum mesophilum]
MKILLLSDCNSIHTIKWATSLFKKSIDVSIFSINKCKVVDYEEYPAIKIYDSTVKVTRSESTLDKVRYLKLLPQLKKVIGEIEPDIVHAHYASSYGVLGALCNFSPFILSVWGSDVFSFPKKSFLYRSILKFNLRKANKILSTSHIMAKETSLYTEKKIIITPFGVDIEKFSNQKKETLFNEEDIVIGTIKALEEIYGIKYLIEAFAVICKKYKNLPLKLLIVGEGSQERELKNQTKKLNIEDKVVFTGKIPFENIPNYHNMLSISVYLSKEESFGVAIIESSSCEKPVIVSNVGGLPEVVKDGVTGIVVPGQNIDKTVQALEKLILDKNLQEQMGKAGRKRVEKMYNWEENVQQMIKIYEEELGV